MSLAPCRIAAMRTVITALALLAAAACAGEDPSPVARELEALDAQVDEGMARIERALGDRSRTFATLGEGVNLVESAARALSALESDPRASDAERVTAALLEARAWDDLALAFSEDRAAAAVPVEQRALVGRLLADKAAPARAAAREGFLGARALACRLGLEAHPAMAEILEGVGRTTDPSPGSPSPCE